jgi:membrane-bound ClpP family serine protease
VEGEAVLTLGIVLLIVGAALAVAEAHLPTGGALGVPGIGALVAGAALTLTALGGGAAVAVPAAAGAGVAATGYLLLATRKVAVARRALARGGSEALVGSAGVVRSWEGTTGQVFVHGALWGARLGWAHEDGPLRAGDHVVIEGVNGLTLSVRKAEEWEVS